MRYLWIVGVLVLPFALSGGAAAASCAAGYQARGDACLGQRMIEFLACVDAVGGNKQKVYDSIASTVKSVGKGDLSAAGSGFVFKGGGTANVDKSTEEQIQKTLSAEYFGDGLATCLKALDSVAPIATPPIEPPKPAAPPPVTVTYRVCVGEYERACQQHDVYLYCYTDVKAWAQQKCTSSGVSRYNTYGGNKCGYGMDLVTCVGPK